MDEDKKNEKIGRAIVTISWWIYAACFLFVVTLIAGAILYFFGKPLWIAPIIAIGCFVVYRLIWRLIWMFIEWAGHQ